MSEGVWVLLVAVAAATAFGLYRAAVDGRFRGTHTVRGSEPAERPEAEPAPSVLAGHDLQRSIEQDLGDRGTLLQFSSAFCAPCRATRRILADVAEIVPGVTHVEIDAEHHLDLVRRLGVTRTPTTLILDAGGRELTRAAGAPTKDAVLATLAKELA